MKLLLIEDDTALPRWRASQPDVVLLDLALPGRDGLAVLQPARDEGLGTPVLILTARGTVGDRGQGLNAGADDDLPKPFDLDELEARVRARYRRHPEIYEKSGSSPRESSAPSYDNESKAGLPCRAFCCPWPCSFWSTPWCPTPRWRCGAGG